MLFATAPPRKHALRHQRHYIVKLHVRLVPTIGFRSSELSGLAFTVFFTRMASSQMLEACHFSNTGMWHHGPPASTLHEGTFRNKRQLFRKLLTRVERDFHPNLLGHTAVECS
jgi:hypothetical protein